MCYHVSAKLCIVERDAAIGELSMSKNCFSHVWVRSDRVRKRVKWYTLPNDPKRTNVFIPKTPPYDCDFLVFLHYSVEWYFFILIYSILVILI
jgi:hypothetical protein